MDSSSEDSKNKSNIHFFYFQEVPKLRFSMNLGTTLNLCEYSALWTLPHYGLSFPQILGSSLAIIMQALLTNVS